ncbi:MAG: chitobiase/beta-hexosaminidase C-terminal domain-containing protein [Lachnospiraceae bacterium]|nr:chitobiase/beta-hexosaminidase C-terminal domain-containing protein [Lachnospiraceae bacterium]
MMTKNRTLLVRLLITALLAGEVLPVSAQDVPYPAEDTPVSAGDLSMSGNGSASSDDTVSDNDDTPSENSLSGPLFVPDYIPDLQETAVLGNGLSFIGTVNAVLDDNPSPESGLSLISPEGAVAEDPAYPCDHENDWLAYFNEKLPPTRDQKDYAAGWAYSAVALAEFYAAGHGLGNKDTDLSEAHLAGWSYTDGTASFAAGDSGDRIEETERERIPDNGGNYLFASQTLWQRGTVSESVLPSSSFPSLSQDGILNAENEYSDGLYLKNAYHISLKDNPMLVRGAIIANGAVGAAMADEQSCMNVSCNAFFCGNSERPADHAVVLVGWDDDYPKENFSPDGEFVPAENGAWLVRSSGSENSCEAYSSYFWLSYEDRSLCGAWAFDLSGEYNGYNRYYYDSQIHDAGYYGDWTGVCGYANVFMVGGSGNAARERLEAVSFEVSLLKNGGAPYTVKIYKDLEGTSPLSGTLVEEATTRGRISYTGSYTVKLKKAVNLNRGSRYSVVIFFDEAGSSVALEHRFMRGEERSVNVGVLQGQSFVSSDRNNFSDVKGDDDEFGNLVIRAMTRDMPDIPYPVGMTVEPASLVLTGEDQTLTATFWDEDGETIPELKPLWRSSNTRVVTVDANGKLKAVKNGKAVVTASYEGFGASCVVTVKIPRSGQTAMPTCDVEDGSVIDYSRKIGLSCITEDAKIYYTTDGTTPTVESTLYDDAEKISVDPDLVGSVLVLKAVAQTEEMSLSEVLTLRFTITTIGRIRISTSGNEAKISSTREGDLTLYAQLYIGEDEQMPMDGYHWSVDDEKVITLGEKAGENASAIRLKGLANGTAKVCVSADDALGERVSTFITISVEIPQTAAPTCAPPGGLTVKAEQRISLKSLSSGAKIWYTLDGSRPVPGESFEYTAPFTIGEAYAGKQLLIRCIACKEGILPSRIVTFCFSVLRGETGGVSPMDPLPQAPELEDSTLYLIKGQKLSVDNSYCSSDKKLVSVKKGVASVKNTGTVWLGPEENYDADPAKRGTGFTVVICKAKLLDRSLKLVAGESGSMRLDLEGYEEHFDNILWLSSNEEVAVVEDGQVRALSAGSAVITAWVNGRALKGKVVVKDTEKLSLPVYGLSAELVLNPMQSLQLKSRAFDFKKALWPELQEVYNNAGRLIAYTDDVVYITTGGKLTAIGSGTSSLKAVDAKDPSREYTLDICVKEPVERTIRLHPGESRKLRFYKVKSEELVWDVPENVTVERSKLSVQESGEYELHAHYRPFGRGGFDYSLRLQVSEPQLQTDEKLVLSGNKYVLNLGKGENYELRWNAFVYQKPLWSSSSRKVFVDEYGRIRAEQNGKAVLRTKVHGRTVKITVRVE